MPKLLRLSILILLFIPGLPADVTANTPRIIRFAGHKWMVKDGLNRPPRSNNWSNDPQSAWIDVDGRLHLKIRQVDGVWYSAQVASMDYARYGVYRFYVETPLADLHDNVVLGLFLYADDENEIDIEVRQRANEERDNLSYAVQPYILDGHRRTSRFDWEGPTVHEIFWQPDFVDFRSLTDDEQASGTILHEWRFDRSGVPAEERNLRIQMNLWLLDPASHDQEVEVVIADVKSPPADWR
jgi:hypothetical protein